MAAGTLRNLFAATLVVAGCYHPQPLDSRALLEELRRSDPLPASASAPAPGNAPVDTLTEAQSIALALAWNRDLRALRATRGVAEGEIMTASELSNPVLRLEMLHAQRGWSGLGWDLRLSWSPPQPGVYGGRKGAARARLEEVDREVGEREWMLACDVREAHATLLAIDEEIRVAEDTITNRRKLAELVNRRVAKGGSTRFDLDLSQLSLASSERAAADRRLARHAAANALVLLLGVGAPAGAVTPVGVLGEEGASATLPSASDLEERALVDRPALAAARARYDASEQTLRAETAARWPWFAFAAIPRLRRNELAVQATDVVFGTDVGLPILNTNRGKVKSASAAREAARAGVVSSLASVRADIARALAAIENHRSVLQHLYAVIQPLLAEHDRLMAMAAQSAELDLPAIVASEDLVLRARTELIATRLALRKAHIALERAVGSRVGTGPR
jgi:outer membrane protein TolC